MVVNPSSLCTLSTASSNVLQSSGTRIAFAAVAVAVDEEPLPTAGGDAPEAKAAKGAKAKADKDGVIEA